MTVTVSRPSELLAGSLAARDLGKINVILGKNGCGKSSFLTGLDAVLSGSSGFRTRYITPERGGALIYEPSVEQNMSRDLSWMSSTRRANRLDLFRQQTVTQYRLLELSVLRALEGAVEAGRRGEQEELFLNTISRINTLLDHVEIRRETEGSGTFVVHNRATGEQVGINFVSSGETELISLAIECLMFAKQCDPAKVNVLLLDEPDVHLHPDLQARLMRLLTQLVDEAGFTILIATHSTPIVAALAVTPDTRVAFMRSGDKILRFQSISDVHRRVLPIFGAHPLSNVFNDAPVLLVEGDDDRRIWQQAIRTSQGALRLYPVACDGTGELANYESVVQEVLTSVYDEPVGYSLRDRDDMPEEIDDLMPLIRCRLSCRSAENLLVTDEVLALESLSWTQVTTRISDWLASGFAHPRREQMQRFADEGYDRKNAKLKDIRMLLVGEMLGSNKPWEVLVGQAIGQAYVAGTLSSGPDSLGDYLGTKFVDSALA